MCINRVALLTSDTHTYTTGAYVVQPASKACSSDTVLGSISECSGAKIVLDAGAPAVTNEEDYAGGPKGCSRLNGKWYFNTHATGALDGESEPICKAVYGNAAKCITCPVLYLVYYYAPILPTIQAIGCKRSPRDAPANAESDWGCRAPRAW